MTKMIMLQFGLDTKQIQNYVSLSTFMAPQFLMSLSLYGIGLKFERAVSSIFYHKLADTEKVFSSFYPAVPSDTIGEYIIHARKFLC